METELPKKDYKFIISSKEFFGNKTNNDVYEISLPDLELKLPKKYIIFEKEEIIYEIRKFDKCGTFLFGDYIMEDNQIYSIQEVDPLFIAIFFLADKIKEKEEKINFLELSSIFVDEPQEFFRILSQNQRLLRGLDNICDKTVLDFDESQTKIMYRLNRTKCCDWIHKKFDLTFQSVSLAFDYKCRLLSEEPKKKIFVQYSLEILFELIPEIIFSQYLSTYHDTTIQEVFKPQVKSEFKQNTNEKEGKSASHSKKPNAKPKITIKEDKTIPKITSFFNKKK